MSRSHYDTIGVAPEASEEEIRDAYLLKLRVFHPDRFDASVQAEEWELANELLRELNEAYSVLRDPVRRAGHDRALGIGRPTGSKAGPTPGPDPAAGPEPGPSHSCADRDRTDQNCSNQNCTDQDRTDRDRTYRARAGQASASQPQDHRAVQPHQHHVPHLGIVGGRIGALLAGQALFQVLDPAVQERLLAYQAWRPDRPVRPGRKAPLFKHQMFGPVGELLGVAYPMAWLATILYYAFTDLEPWRPHIWIVVLIITAIQTSFLWRAIYWLVRWRMSTLKCYLYVTPLYVIRTWLDGVHYYPVWTLLEPPVRRQDRLSRLTGTKLTVRFAKDVERLTFDSPETRDSFIEALDRARAEVLRRKAAEDWEFFWEEDDFREIVSRKKRPKDRVFTPRSLKYLLACLALVGLVLTVAATENLSRPSPDLPQAQASEQVPAQPQARPASLSSPTAPAR